MRNVLYFAAAFLVVGMSVARADYISAIKEGNKAFEKKDYGKALDYYNQAAPDLPVSPELDYNIGGALHGTGDLDGAIKHYQAALKSPDINIEAQAHYNLGNTYYRKKDYQHAIESYQEALKLHPEDMDSKFNLELARKMLKEQMKPQQDQQGKDQDKQKQNQQNQQSPQDQQDKQKQNQQQDQQKDQDKQNQPDQQKQQNPQNQPNQSKKMSKEDAARILNALRDDEQDLQKKVKREAGKGDYVGKDW
jgi:Ca-activated chloride channel family protein